VEPGFGTQFGDGSLLDFVGDCVELAAVVGGDCEVDHGGAAENSGCRVWVVVVVPEGCIFGWAGGCAVDAAAEGNPDSGDVAGGFARDGGYHAGGDADGSAFAELEGVPDVGDEFADLAGYGGFQGRRNGDVFGGEAAHGCPDAAEFLQSGLAVKTAALVVSELACVPVGGLFEQFVDVGAAGEVAGCSAEQLADVVDRLARIGHSRSPPLL
jgi:hypothetical protein